ncbi:hypothetical protein DL764_007062 [Monosporascus ibericus]|uniref:RRM domain-containing protein n=1 Tax=Monosporascus ibericus TaxID=155417 RepID=A0A4Q4T6D1_9PEZI|nr:hypothetical protein DL764_007062 [Monosporascus ibericus]
MSYPPPPGSNTTSTSLPPRPPPSKIPGGFKSSAFSPVTATAHTPSPGPIGPSPYAAPPPAYSSAPSYPGAAVAPHYGAPSTSTYQPYPQPVAGMTSSYASHHAKPYQYPQAAGYQQQPSYYGSQPPAAAAATAATSSYNTPPQIRNPFPVPSPATKSGDDYDTDMAAQIAQWQSAYVKDPTKDAGGTTSARPGGAAGPNGGTTTYAVDANKASDANAAAGAGEHPGGKKKTVVRAGGGQKWTDDTLLEWDPSHLRLFVGNLAGETTDESLYKAFSRWRSLQKARVIRDKVTSKSRGYGFVSFSDPDEFFQAAKEMNGKYIQSHPVVVRKSTTEIKPTTVKEKGGAGGKWKNSSNNKNKNRAGNGNGRREGSFEPHLGPAGGGVTKPGQKTKGGLKLLG